MAYDSTTAIPSEGGSRAIIKQETMNNTSTYPNPVWIPPVGSRVVLTDVIMSLRERDSTAGRTAELELQLMRGGTWETLARVGQKGNGFASFHHAFAGKLASDKNDGVTTTQLRVVSGTGPAINSTAYDMRITLVGRHES